MGKIRFVALEGCDGSGKTTQAALVSEGLAAAGVPVHRLKFPDYASPSSGPLKMYLDGRLSERPGEISPKAASLLYAVDRFCSFKSGWEKYYADGALILSDRYVTSNMVFQGAKVPRDRRGEFVEWVKKTEYGLFGLPEPDLVLYLDMDPETSRKLTHERAECTGQCEDIHEIDLDYRREVFFTGRELAQSQGWTVVSCTDGGVLLGAEELSRRIVSIILEAMK